MVHKFASLMNKGEMIACDNRSADEYICSSVRLEAKHQGPQDSTFVSSSGFHKKRQRPACRRISLEYTERGILKLKQSRVRREMVQFM